MGHFKFKLPSQMYPDGYPVGVVVISNFATSNLVNKVSAKSERINRHFPNTGN